MGSVDDFSLLLLRDGERYDGDNRRILGAVAGGVVDDEVAQYAHEKGRYVIVQSGRASHLSEW